MAKCAILRPEVIAKMAEDPDYCAKKIGERLERIYTLETVRKTLSDSVWRRLRKRSEESRLLLELAKAICRGEEVWLRRPAWRQLDETTPLRMTLHTLDRMLTPEGRPYGTMQQIIDLLLEEFTKPYTEPQKNNLRIPTYLNADARIKFVEAHTNEERENAKNPTHDNHVDLPDFSEYLHDRP